MLCITKKKKTYFLKYFPKNLKELKKKGPSPLKKYRVFSFLCAIVCTMFKKKINLIKTFSVFRVYLKREYDSLKNYENKVFKNFFIAFLFQLTT